jgi:hypothetical protein
MHAGPKCQRQATITRRALIAASAAALAAPVFDTSSTIAAPSPAPGACPFAHRGYYLTFMRMPTYGLAAWKQTIDTFAEDDINLLILWMAGGFRSRKFPITWRYNADHQNVRADFAADLIRHAQSRNIKVLLGFTPFGYDGVNQFALEHPELKARGKEGRPVDEFGIHSWGWNLCPSRPESQRFMLDYAGEMFFEFYPGADGLLIESSDYAICHCPDCAGRFYDREFELVSTLSAAVWKADPDAMIAVYPHYFSGSQVPGLDADAARHPFDPRWTLFFTPHSAHPDADLIARARSTIWSDDAPALHDPQAIRAGARRARAAGITGCAPSLESFSYVPTHVEEGRPDLVGRRQVPFGFGWLDPAAMPYNELPVRVNRIAYREFSKDPSVPYEEFNGRLARAVFGPGDVPAVWTDDLLMLHRAFFEGRTWCQPAPLASPARVRLELAAGRVNAGKRAEYRAAIKTIEQMTLRHAGASNPGRRELHRISKWVIEQWTPAALGLLDGTGGS